MIRFDLERQLDAVLEEQRLRSHEILETCAHELPQMLERGDLWATVDRGYARSFLSMTESEIPLFARARFFLIATDVLLILVVAICVALGFMIFGWWGSLFLVAIPIFVVLNWRSAQLPTLKGRLPKVSLAVFSVLFVYFFTIRSSWELWLLMIALAIISAVSLTRYWYPLRIVRRALIEFPDTASALVDSRVVTLHHRHELSDVQNRGF